MRKVKEFHTSVAIYEYCNNTQKKQNTEKQKPNHEAPVRKNQNSNRTIGFKKRPETGTQEISPQKSGNSLNSSYRRNASPKKSKPVKKFKR